MSEFLAITLSYPTVVFTIMLGVVFVYWTLVIVGALGIDVLDMDIDADGVAEGAAQGVAEAAAEGASEGLVEGVAASHGAFYTLLHVLRLRKAPVTLVLSLVLFWSWFFSHLGSMLLLPLLSFLPLWISGTLVGLGAVAVAFPMTSLCLAPMRGLFKPERQITREDLVGKVVRISTSHVDARFGVATADDGGAGLIVQVRCDAENDLARGQKALVLAWDSAREAYEVTPMDDILPPDLSRKS